MDPTLTPEQIARGINMAADRYSKMADKAETDAKTDRQRASWFSGQAAGLRQAAIDFRMLADLAAAKPDA